MSYIHKRKDWPGFRWAGADLAPLLADVRHRQGRLLGRMESLGFPLRNEAHLLTLTADVVKSSAIEGERLDAEQVRSSIARKLGLDAGGAAPVARHVEGIVEMMMDATQKYAAPLTAKRLFGWHAALFPTGRSHLRKIAAGCWRPESAGPMQVVSGPLGREKVHFEAPAARRVAGEMNGFLKWFNAPPDTDPIWRAALAHFWFVTIHPFEDGNGRMARAIADMALAQADNTPQHYYSMSAQIEVERKMYYSTLEQNQQGGLDITGWMKWFLECLGRAIESAECALSGVLRKAELWRFLNQGPTHGRQGKVINRLLDDFKGPLTTSKYAKLTACSTDTALRDIRELLDRKVLFQNSGGGRSVSYRLATPEEIRTETSRL